MSLPKIRRKKDKTSSKSKEQIIQQKKINRAWKLHKLRTARQMGIISDFDRGQLKGLEDNVDIEIMEEE